MELSFSSIEKYAKYSSHTWPQKWRIGNSKIFKTNDGNAVRFICDHVVIMLRRHLVIVRKDVSHMRTSYVRSLRVEQIVCVS